LSLDGGGEHQGADHGGEHAHAPDAESSHQSRTSPRRAVSSRLLLGALCAPGTGLPPRQRVHASRRCHRAVRASTARTVPITTPLLSCTK
jgi:hypothetical protein